MNVERHQAVIIGGGPAGLAAAIRLRQKGVDDVVVLEREHRPGGILRQCIHDGFGLTRFGETLSGPEYAQRFVAQAEELGITSPWRPTAPSPPPAPPGSNSSGATR